MRSAKVQCSIELIAFTLFMSKTLLVESFPRSRRSPIEQQFQAIAELVSVLGF